MFLRQFVADRLSLTSIRVENAVDMDAETFQAMTTFAYENLGTAIQEREGGRHNLVRVWNFIPSILDPLGMFKQRYMVFNAGRYAAYEKRYGGRDRFPVAVATASGVGHRGTDLVIHGFATAGPGTPMENPRQVPSYHYSKEFGQIPPCFARGTLVNLREDGGATLLVGGTASIRGEKTMFEEDLEAQISETLTNLDTLVAVGCHKPLDIDTNQHGSLMHLRRFRHLRIYFRDFPPPEHSLRRLLGQFSELKSLEIAEADVCRPGLLVEIEGVASVA